MTEISDWFQNNWIDLARLLVQCGILVAVVRIGRKLLATLRASQEQVGALLRLSVSDTVGERRETATEPHHVSEALPEPARRFEPPIARAPEPEPERELEPEPVFAGGFSRTDYAAEREQSLGGRVGGVSAPTFSTALPRAESPSFTPWVSAPASAPERLSPEISGAIPARASASAWLQAPMTRSSGSPWRKMVRWLQAPAGR
jgi:hypothetical protein